MTTKITVSQLADTVAGLAEAQAAQADSIGKILQLVQAQHSTPTTVADTVAETPADETPKTASDELLDYVTEQGLAFARGGRSYLTQDHLKAAVRVLKTGKPEVLPYGADSKLTKRGVSHIAMARNEDGTVLTQFVYTPES
jgi:hypothetical protein